MGFGFALDRRFLVGQQPAPKYARPLRRGPPAPNGARAGEGVSMTEESNGSAGPGNALSAKRE